MRNDPAWFNIKQDIEGWDLLKGAFVVGRFLKSYGWTRTTIDEMVEALNRSMRWW